MIKKYLEFIKEQASNSANYEFTSNYFIIGNFEDVYEEEYGELSGIYGDIDVEPYIEDNSNFQTLIYDYDFFYETLKKEIDIYIKEHYLKPLQKLNALIKNIQCTDFMINETYKRYIFQFKLTANNNTPLLLAQHLENLKYKMGKEQLNEYIMDNLTNICDGNEPEYNMQVFFDDDNNDDVDTTINALLNYDTYETIATTKEDYVGFALTILMFDVIKIYNFDDFAEKFSKKYLPSYFLKVEFKDNFKHIDDNYKN